MKIGGDNGFPGVPGAPGMKGKCWKMSFDDIVLINLFFKVFLVLLVNVSDNKCVLLYNE